MDGFRYDTQLLIEGKNLNEDAIDEYFTKNFEGDCLLVVGDESVAFLRIEPFYRTLTHLGYLH